MCDMCTILHCQDRCLCIPPPPFYPPSGSLLISFSLFPPFSIFLLPSLPFLSPISISHSSTVYHPLPLFSLSLSISLLHWFSVFPFLSISGSLPSLVSSGSLHPLYSRSSLPPMLSYSPTLQLSSPTPPLSRPPLGSPTPLPTCVSSHTYLFSSVLSPHSLFRLSITLSPCPYLPHSHFFVSFSPSLHYSLFPISPLISSLSPLPLYVRPLSSRIICLSLPLPLLPPPPSLPPPFYLSTPLSTSLSFSLLPTLSRSFFHSANLSFCRSLSSSPFSFLPSLLFSPYHVFSPFLSLPFRIRTPSHILFVYLYLSSSSSLFPPLSWSIYSNHSHAKLLWDNTWTYSLFCF